MLTADLYYSFRSPYSYLSVERYRALVRDWQLEIALRPVYPIAVRNPGFFSQVNPLWVDYLLADVERVAEFNDIPFGWPRPDPVVMDRKAGTIPAKQPLIRNLTRMGMVAAERGRGLDFAAEVGNTLWGERVENWHEDGRLAPAVARAGLDLDDLQAEVDARADALDEAIHANEAAEEKAGHWGTPCLVFRDEPFFGQDRIDMALWRMKQAGLERR